MDPRRDAMDDEQFLMDMIASGSDADAHDEEAGDASNTDICSVMTELSNL